MDDPDRPGYRGQRLAPWDPMVFRRGAPQAVRGPVACNSHA